MIVFKFVKCTCNSKDKYMQIYYWVIPFLLKWMCLVFTTLVKVGPKIYVDIPWNIKIFIIYRPMFMMFGGRLVAQLFEHAGAF